jgi:DNA-binding Xre family transcriptional regulator
MDELVQFNLKKLQQLLGRCCITVTQLETIMNTRPLYWTILCDYGRTSKIRLSVLRALCSAFDADLGDLLII